MAKKAAVKKAVMPQAIVTDEAATPVVEAPKVSKTGNWRDPNYKPAEGDNSIDARMKRLTDEIRD